jgi:hypothetical protein
MGKELTSETNFGNTLLISLKKQNIQGYQEAGGFKVRASLYSQQIGSRCIFFHV